jgi:hypothetical protein
MHQLTLRTGDPGLDVQALIKTDKVSPGRLIGMIRTIWGSCQQATT